MAKRRAAEPLTFHVPWKRLLLCDFTEEPPPPPLWVPPSGTAHPGQPRKRKIDAGAMTELSVSPSKRRGSGDSDVPGGEEPASRGLETGEPSQSPCPGGPAGRGRSCGTPGPRGAVATTRRGAQGPGGETGGPHRASTMKNFGSITRSSTGGILYHLLTWQTLKM
uniref:Uncharacterized protein n=1 Tax=Castor canadensis TaxID=51338 RepID=A0A8C0XI49_CASCN